MTDLGAGMAFGINASGEAVGQTGIETYQAVLFSNGGMTNLTPFGSGVAYGINDSGQIVGDSASSAFLYSNGVMTYLTPPGTDLSTAAAINNSGQIAGQAGVPGVAFLYSDGAFTPLSLPAPYNYESRATGINASGQVIGDSEDISSSPRAFLYSGGKMTDLGTLGNWAASMATGINDSGQVVGVVYTPSGGSSAFIYTNGSMIDLNSLIPANSGFTLDGATAINDSGEIVGVSSNGDTLLLTPVDLPEPGGISLLVIAGAGLLARRRAANQRQKRCSYGGELRPDAQ
jgi:probable HAF family extracellular repeat protein